MLEAVHRASTKSRVAPKVVSRLRGEVGGLKAGDKRCPLLVTRSSLSCSSALVADSVSSPSPNSVNDAADDSGWELQGHRMGREPHQLGGTLAPSEQEQQRIETHSRCAPHLLQIWV